MRTLSTILIFLTISLPLPAIADSSNDSFWKEGSLETILSTGIYENTRWGKLSVLYSEKGTPLKIRFSSRENSMEASIQEMIRHPCGDELRGTAVTDERSIKTEFLLIDYSNIRCRIFVKYKWKLQMRSFGSSGAISEMEMQGNPEIRNEQLF